ncbi:hypothetical protein SDJN03_18275, partial [Cucurbita argyrosperma subsp. sororia]
MHIWLENLWLRSEGKRKASSAQAPRGNGDSGKEDGSLKQKKDVESESKTPFKSHKLRSSMHVEQRKAKASQPNNNTVSILMETI